MDPITMAIIGGATSLAGPVLGYMGQQDTNRSNETTAKDATAANMADAARNRDFQAAQSAQQMAYQTAEADKARKWEESMSNTAYQRSKQDMIKAGINPILAQSPASTPSVAAPSGASGSGAQGSATTIAKQNPLANIDLTTALSAAKVLGDISLQSKQGKLLDAQTIKTGVDAEVSKKGIPQSDFINKMYQALTESAKKMKTNWDLYNSTGKSGHFNNRKP